MPKFLWAILPGNSRPLYETLPPEPLLLFTAHLMSKSKKKDSKKSPHSPGLLDSATGGLKKFRRLAKQVQKLSPAQKVVGGLALLGAGYAFLTKSSGGAAGAAEAAAPEEPAAPSAQATPNKVAGASAPPSAPKPKRNKLASPHQHSPFSQESP